jgi:membrane-bound metal-dependent hydrolase YbcI (DUF457 family)
MNTPTHVLVNLALLGRKATRGECAAVAAGAVLPDLPIFLFALSSFLLGTSGEEMWSRAYFSSRWHWAIDPLHSFPLIALGLAVARLRGWRPGQLFFASLFLHALLDFPVHVEDAHPQLFPFSGWRFRSPVSYWDPRHHGAAGATVELLLVLAASVALWRRAGSRPERAVLAAYSVLHLLAWGVLVARVGGGWQQLLHAR